MTRSRRLAATRPSTPGPVYGSLEASAITRPCSIPCVTRRAASRFRGAIRTHRSPRRRWCSTLRVPGPRSRIWTSKANGTTDARSSRAAVADVQGAPQREPGNVQRGLDASSAKLPPVNAAGRHLAMYDPARKRRSSSAPASGRTPAVCRGREQHAVDEQRWGRRRRGWLNTKMFDETGDEEKSQGWTALILDPTGTGSVTSTPKAPRQSIRPRTGAWWRPSTAWRRAADGSVVGLRARFPVRSPGRPRRESPATALSEVYEVPWNNPRARSRASRRAAWTSNRNGVVWVSLASGHYGSFDRRAVQGTDLNGPTAQASTPRGLEAVSDPGPNFKGATDSANVDSHYYNGWTSTTRSAWAANCRSSRKRVGLAFGAQHPERAVHHAARPVSARLLLERAGRPRRDPRGGLEGKGLWQRGPTRARSIRKAGRT